METAENAHSTLQAIKQSFFVMRNGIIADTLRKGGSPFKVIFGLNLPQLVEIAEGADHSVELARKLWENNTTRESMLLAPMLYPREDFDRTEAEKWIASIPTAEVADILCHRLLKHMPYATELAETLCASSKEMDRYTGLRIFFNLVATYPDKALSAARHELENPSPLTERISHMLAEEAEFQLGI